MGHVWGSLSTKKITTIKEYDPGNKQEPGSSNEHKQERKSLHVKSHFKQMSVIKSAHDHRRCIYNNTRVTQDSWKTSEASGQRRGSTRVPVVPRLSTKCTKEKQQFLSAGNWHHHLSLKGQR